MTTVLTTTQGDINVLSATIDETLKGAWTARVQVDSDADISGTVTLSNDGTTAWVGTVLRGTAQEHGRVIAQIVGGGGGLSTQLGALNYDSATLADILADILAEAGEVISPTVSVDTLLALVERWSRPTGPAGLSVQQVVDEADAEHWRVLRTGLVWLGNEDYPVVPDSFQFQEIARIPDKDQIIIAPEDDQVLVAAGDNFLGRNVAAVSTVIDPSSQRQVITWEDEDPGTEKDRKTGVLKRLVETFVGRRIDYAKMYPSVVNEQNADGTLDLTPDDDKIKGDGFKNIKISYGLPGVTATVPAGGRVNLYFQNGDPKQPRAALWEGSGVTLITVGASGSAKVVVLDGDDLVKSAEMVVWMGQIETYINSIAGGTVAPLSPTFGLGTVDGTSSKLKSE